MILNYDKDNKDGFFDGFTSFLINAKKEVPDVSDEIQKLFSSFGSNKKLTNLLESFDSSTLKDDTFKSWIDGLNDTAKASMTAGDALEAYKKHLTDIGKTTTGVQKTTSVFNALGGTLLSTLGNMAIMYAASAAIEFIGTKIYEYIYATELAIEAGEKAQNNIKEVYDTYNNKVSTVTDLGRQFASDAASINTTSDAVESLTQKYAELKKGVNADNSNKSLSSKEYQQYLDISNQLAKHSHHWLPEVTLPEMLY